jgi:hypothetical protein
MSFFVIVISANGQPGNLIGPCEWEDAVAKIQKLVSEGVAGNGALTLSDEDKAIIADDGSYEYGDGSGIFTVCPEPLEVEAVEEAPTAIQQLAANVGFPASTEQLSQLQPTAAPPAPETTA